MTSDADNNVAVVEADNNVPVVEADNNVPVVEADNNVPVVEADNNVAVVEADGPGWKEFLNLMKMDLPAREHFWDLVKMGFVNQIGLAGQAAVQVAGALVPALMGCAVPVPGVLAAAPGIVGADWRGLLNLVQMGELERRKLWNLVNLDLCGMWIANMVNQPVLMLNGLANCAAYAGQFAKLLGVILNRNNELVCIPGIICADAGFRVAGAGAVELAGAAAEIQKWIGDVVAGANLLKNGVKELKVLIVLIPKFIVVVGIGESFIQILPYPKLKSKL